MKTKIQIDNYLKGTERFWYRLQKHCCLECCGFDALDLSVSHVLWASQNTNIKMLINKLNNIILVLENYPFTTAESREILCFARDKAEFIDVFRKIQHILLGVYY